MVHAGTENNTNLLQDGYCISQYKNNELKKNKKKEKDAYSSQGMKIANCSFPILAIIFLDTSNKRHKKSVLFPGRDI